MPIWSLTDERVEDLKRQMETKKQEYEVLFNKHIHSLWNEDLDQFLAELTKYEEQEERDRLAHG